MGCGSCSSSKGCGNNGLCGTGGCNKLSTFDWLSDIVLPEDQAISSTIEVSFHDGARKGFYKNDTSIRLEKGQMVAVEAMSGHDVGEVSLTGMLCFLQMKKKNVTETSPEVKKVYRLATNNDLEKLSKARKKEREILVSARAIARQMGLEIKIGDVEYQGDLKKLTVYFTAEGRIDFRELVKEYAKEFRSKIEMRQIGLRQEAGKIGGIGSCGRELCCSTWLTDFKSVSTNAARYQNLSINSARLSGQCGRLKCCLNYELDSYLECLQEFPRDMNTLETKKGIAKVIKTDILKKVIYFTYSNTPAVYTLEVKRVNELLEQQKAGKIIEDLAAEDIGGEKEEIEEETTHSVGQLSLKQIEKKGKKKRKKKKTRKPQAK